jgi:hypothetical protein
MQDVASRPFYGTYAWAYDYILTQVGFDAMEYFGDYDQTITPGSTDRLVSVACLR